MTRNEAQNITNIHILQRFIGDVNVENSSEYQILLNFCDAFNNTLPLIPYLFECTENPFINKINNKIDLSGTKTQNIEMSPNTSINFSIPSTCGNDAAGFCTIRILSMLEKVMLDLLPNNQTYAINYLTPSSIIKQQLIFYGFYSFIVL